MKNIFQPALIGMLAFLVSCNDSSTSTSETADTTKMDTAPAMSDNSAMTSNVMTKTLDLTADQEVPANKSTATGTADVTYNKDTKVLSYTVNYKGLTGKASMAHIHGTAPKGTNAGVKRDLTPMLQKETAGSFMDSVKIEESGISEDSLMSGFYYFNIHTPANPGGEIRGQISF